MIFTAIGRDHHGNLFILFQPIFLCCHQQYHLLASHKERIPKEVCNPHWVAEPSAGKTFFPPENPFSLWFLSSPGVTSPVKDKALLPFCIAPPARVLDFNFRNKNRYEQENLLCYCHHFSPVHIPPGKENCCFDTHLPLRSFSMETLKWDLLEESHQAKLHLNLLCRSLILENNEIINFGFQLWWQRWGRELRSFWRNYNTLHNT